MGGQRIDAAPPRVLVVDDDAAVRRAAVRMLTHLGCEVVAVEGAEQALCALADEPSKLDLAMIDLSMPGVSGAELVARLRASGDRMPILVVSGLAACDIQRQVSGERIGLLQKPYTIAELREQVFALLGACAGRGG